jgi:hypothetical protein
MKMDSELIKELNKRGTVELHPTGKVNQVTQALDETPTRVKLAIFGEIKTFGVIPINDACAKCDHCHFATVKQCQDRQSIDAKARGFNQIICPEQLLG